jgi:hypothetical protein
MLIRAEQDSSNSDSALIFFEPYNAENVYTDDKNIALSASTDKANHLSFCNINCCHVTETKKRARWQGK